MTPLPPAPVVEAGAVGSLKDGKIGAFDAPAVSTNRVDAGQAAAGQSPAKPQTSHLAVDLGSGKTAPAKTVEVPAVPWKAPVTVEKAEKPGGQRAVITYVGDGDSVGGKLKQDGSKIACRIDSIDAPETAKPKLGKAGQAYGEESKRTLEEMILWKEVTIRVTKPKGKYDRDYCQIEIEGESVDKKMLQAGAAYLYRRYNNSPDLAQAESEAKAAKRGLWADPGAISPEAFRRSQDRK